MPVTVHYPAHSPIPLLAYDSCGADPAGSNGSTPPSPRMLHSLGPVCDLNSRLSMLLFAKVASIVPWSCQCPAHL